MSVNSILEVTEMVKSFGGVNAVNGLTFSLNKGEIFGLLGPNGAGKTTTIKLILGVISPTKGNVKVFGMDPERDELEIKQRIGYIAEDPLIYKSLTPKELFDFIASIRKLSSDDMNCRLQEYLDSFDAIKYYNQLISTLSRGNKQKIQIIAALLHEPSLLILDEPLSGLDAKSVKVFKEILEIHTNRGGSVLFSTHIMEVAEQICDRIGIINHGKIIAMGSVDDLRRAARIVDADSDLEDIFLQLTDESKNIAEIVNRLKFEI